MYAAASNIKDISPCCFPPHDLHRSIRDVITTKYSYSIPEGRTFMHSSVTCDRHVLCILSWLFNSLCLEHDSIFAPGHNYNEVQRCFNYESSLHVLSFTHAVQCPGLLNLNTIWFRSYNHGNHYSTRRQSWQNHSNATQFVNSLIGLALFFRMPTFSQICWLQHRLTVIQLWIAVQ